MGTFRFYKGYFRQGNAMPLLTVRGNGVFHDADAHEAAQDMAKAMKSCVSVTDDSATWCTVYDANGKQVAHSFDHRC